MSPEKAAELVSVPGLAVNCVSVVLEAPEYTPKDSLVACHFTASPFASSVNVALVSGSPAVMVSGIIPLSEEEDSLVQLFKRSTQVEAAISRNNDFFIASKI